VKKSKFSEDQIVRALREGEAGAKVGEAVCKDDLSHALEDIVKIAPQRSGYCLDVLKRNVAFTPLHAANISAVEVGAICQFLLGYAALLS
jgi:hypothetical protein